MNSPMLRYKPIWYHLGDADSVPLALACGALALGTIFLVEYISAALLSSKANGILISDAAALIAFNNSSWLEVLRWVFVKRPRKTLDRRICKRAVAPSSLSFFVSLLS